ncbi:uncharacterized protein TNCV_5035361 [Trichonephila clavipes]|nr:uncharacterized protein TNCV_5035361 [Trichonephila clavipes]
MVSNRIILDVGQATGMTPELATVLSTSAPQQKEAFNSSNLKCINPLCRASLQCYQDFPLHESVSTSIPIDIAGIEVYVGLTFQDGNRFNSCQVIYSQFGLAIHQNDHQARRRFVEWAQNEITVVPNFHKRILFSDEAHFWLNGYVNKQNCRIWSEANPQVYVETPLHPEKTDSLLWFQQDGATCHTARATIDVLKDTLGDRLISRFGPVNWPPRSCDLTPLDYFLWGYVKSLVYADKPQTLDHLEDNICRVIADMWPQMLEKVIENWTSRLDYIRASRGSPMPEIIIKI